MSDGPRVRFRAGTLQDWPIVAPIVSRVWDGTDYINEDVWRRWVADETGTIIIGTVGGIVAGFARLTMLTEGEWWLEGARVAQTYQGRGVGQAIVGQAVELFKKHGSGILRCAVESGSDASQRMVESHRFRNTLSLATIEAPADEGHETMFHVMEPETQDIIRQYWRYSPMYRINNFYEFQWVLYSLSDERLVKFLHDDEIDVLGWREFDQLHGVAIISNQTTVKRYQQTQVLYVSHLDAPDDTTLVRMLKALQHLAFELGLDKVRWKMPRRVGFDEPLAAAGFSPATNSELWLYELAHRGL